METEFLIAITMAAESLLTANYCAALLLIARLKPYMQPVFLLLLLWCRSTIPIVTCMHACTQVSNIYQALLHYLYIYARHKIMVQKAKNRILIVLNSINCIDQVTYIEGTLCVGNKIINEIKF